MVFYTIILYLLTGFAIGILYTTKSFSNKLIFSSEYCEYYNDEKNMQNLLITYENADVYKKTYIIDFVTGCVSTKHLTNKKVFLIYINLPFFVSEQTNPYNLYNFPKINNKDYGNLVIQLDKALSYYFNEKSFFQNHSFTIHDFYDYWRPVVEDQLKIKLVKPEIITHDLYINRKYYNTAIFIFITGMLFLFTYIRKRRTTENKKKLLKNRG